VKPKVVVLISGNGSNLQAIIDAIEAGQLNVEIACVISDKADAYGLQRAEKHQIPTEILTKQTQETREQYDERLITLIQQYQPELIVLAGFMRILSKYFVETFTGKIINIHPSLLPKYPGLHTHQQVLQNGDTEHGCTIHYVTEDVDAGEIIAQAKLTVNSDDTEETLKQRVHALEHQLYPATIQKYLNECRSD